MASCAAVVVLSTPSDDVENALASSDDAAPTPVFSDVISSAYSLLPTSSAVAVMPAFAPLIADTTDDSDPSPTDTFCAVIEPTLSPPDSSAVIVPPVPEFKETDVVPEP